MSNHAKEPFGNIIKIAKPTMGFRLTFTLLVLATALVARSDANRRWKRRLGGEAEEEDRNFGKMFLRHESTYKGQQIS